MNFKWRAALLVLVPLAAYASSLRSGFVWDDHQVIEHGRLIGSLANVPALFSHDTMFNSDGGAFAARAHVDTYRPLTMTTFFVEHALWGVRAWAYHLDSVLIHVVNVLLLYAVGAALGLSAAAALVGALLFAAHPAIGEAVHWVNGRSDPLCVMFFLVAVLAWLRGQVALVIAAALAATLCKETAFMLLPPLVLLRRKGVWQFAAGAALGLGCRLLALRHAAVSAGAPHLAYAALRVVPLWADALRALALPVGQAPPSLFDRYRHVGAGWLAAAAAPVLLACAVAGARWRRGDFWWAWALATFFSVLAPVALLTFDEGWFGWGRYLYPAAPVLALAAGHALVDGALPRLRPSLRQFAAGALALVIALMALVTFTAAGDWKDDRAFARAMVNDHPDSSMGYSELAAVELRDGNAAEALALCERALAIAPANARHWSRAASALMQLGRRAEAFTAAERALALDPEDPNARYVTAIRRLGERREAEAAVLLLDAIAADPEQAGPWETLRQARAHLGPNSLFAETVRALTAREPRYAQIAPRVNAAY